MLEFTASKIDTPPRLPCSDVEFSCSDRMLKLCLDLRGFYLKSGQFLGTRHDFMPKIYLRKLGWAFGTGSLRCGQDLCRQLQ